MDFPNLDIVKDELKNWYNSGQYFKDITLAIEPAYTYIGYVIGIDKAAVIFDIDETMVSEYDFMLANDFAWTGPIIDAAQTITTFSSLLPTLDFFNYCSQKNIETIILTSRRKKHEDTVLALLSNAKYVNYSRLILRPNDDIGSIAGYKARMRKELIEQEGYLIQCNLGDQESDFYQGYSYFNIKIPNKFYAIGLEQ